MHSDSRRTKYIYLHFNLISICLGLCAWPVGCLFYGISTEVEAVELETDEAFLWLRICESVSLLPVVVGFMEAPVMLLALFPTLTKVSSRNRNFVLALKLINQI